jgi:hypothetical protein
MFTRRWLLLGFWATCVAAAGIVAACGGDTADVNDAGGGGQDATTSDDGSVIPNPGNDSGNNNPGDDASSTSDTGGGNSDGGGSGSNPGKITCGAAQCNATDQTCCDPIGDAAPYCRDAGTPGFCQGVTYRCDEKADCADGGICCYDFGGGVDTQCRAACNFGRVQACKTSAECTEGDAGCRQYTCFGGLVVQTCVRPQGCQ